MNEYLSFCYDSKVTYEARFVGDHEFIVTSVKLFNCGLCNKRNFLLEKKSKKVS